MCGQIETSLWRNIYMHTYLHWVCHLVSRGKQQQGSCEESHQGTARTCTTRNDVWSSGWCTAHSWLNKNNSMAHIHTYMALSTHAKQWVAMYNTAHSWSKRNSKMTHMMMYNWVLEGRIEQHDTRITVSTFKAQSLVTHVDFEAKYVVCIVCRSRHWLDLGYTKFIDLLKIKQTRLRDWQCRMNWKSKNCRQDGILYQ